MVDPVREAWIVAVGVRHILTESIPPLDLRLELARHWLLLRIYAFWLALASLRRHGPLALLHGNVCPWRTFSVCATSPAFFLDVEV